MLKRRVEHRLESLYKRDPDTGEFAIEIDLDAYGEVFNEWDRGPLRSRDIDPDLLTFLERCSADIPLKLPIGLHFYLPAAERNPAKEAWLARGFRNYFELTEYQVARRIVRSKRMIMVYVLVAFVFLFSAYLAQPLVERRLLLQTLSEGLFIGGWVFLWEAFSRFSFTNREMAVELREARRFLKAPIRFHYERRKRYA